MSPQAFDERIIPDETAGGIVAHHLKKYDFARPFCAGQTVLDAGCGVGYGTAFLAAAAGRIEAVDVSAEAIEIARKRYQKPNISFHARDICELDFEPRSFGVICSFEVIEHVPDIKRYLERIGACLKEDGVLIISTPYTPKTNEKPENPYHYKEWSPEDFRALLRNYFDQVRLYGQIRRQTPLHRLLQRLDVFGLRRCLPRLAGKVARAAGTAPFTQMKLEDMEIVEETFRGASEVLAVCRSPKEIAG